MSDRDSSLEALHSASPSLPVSEVREGLPAHYRMRADAHYVDQLDVPPASSVQMVALESIDAPEGLAPPGTALLDSITRHGVLEPLLLQKRNGRYKLIAGQRRFAAATALGLSEVPCVVRRLTDEEARSLAAVMPPPLDVRPPAQHPKADLDYGQIVASLSSVLSCADLLIEGMPLLTRAVAVEMIRAETQRAICSLRTAAVLQGAVSEAPSPVSVRRVLDAVVQAVGADARLRGSRLTTRVDVNDEAMIFAEEQHLVAAVSAVVLLLSAGLRDIRGARLELHVTSAPSDRITLAVSQESVILPNAALAMANAENAAFDSSVAPLVALRQLAESYGGTSIVTRLARGTQVSVTLRTGE